MKLIAIYKEHEAIKAVYCPTCFTFFKLNGKLEGYKTVETEAVPNLCTCSSCKNNQGLSEQQIKERLANEEYMKNKLLRYERS